MAQKADAAPLPTTRRGRAGRDLRVLSPLEQVRRHHGGPAAYYLRPDGMTLREVIITYPNGNDQPDNASSRAAKFVKNADYYQRRQARKGFEYVGPTLTVEGVEKAIRILERNREEWITFLQEEIAQCSYLVKNTAEPKVVDQQRQRQAAYQKQLDEALLPFDPEKLVVELNEIAQAQQIAAVDPRLAQTVKLLVGNRLDVINENVRRMAEEFSKDRRMSTDVDDNLAGPDHIAVDRNEVR